MKFAILVTAFFVGCAPQIMAQHNSNFSFLSYQERTGNTKHILDDTDVKQWISLGPDSYLRLSSDGRYFSYMVRNKPIGESTMVIQSTLGNWSKESPFASPGFFTKDNKVFVFTVKDTLYLQKLGKPDIKRIFPIVSYKIPKVEQGEWLAYQVKDENRSLVILNLLDGTEYRYSNVTDYSFSDRGNILVYTTQTHTPSDGITTSLQWVQIKTNKSKIIWSTNSPSISMVGYVTDSNAEQIAFALKKKRQDTIKCEIWYYRKGMEYSILKTGNLSNFLEGGVVNISSLSFSKNDDIIFFSLLTNIPVKATNEAVAIDIWSTKDTILQGIQLLNKQTSISYRYCLNLKTGKVLRLTNNEYEHLWKDQYIGDYFVLITSHTSGDRFWLKEYNSLRLFSLRNESHKTIPTEGPVAELNLSLNEKYLIYYDGRGGGNFFSYNLSTGKSINISKNVPPGTLKWNVDVELNTDSSSRFTSDPVGIAAWIEDANKVLVYDNYDIWQLDMTGKEEALCITNNFGKLNNIKLRISHTGWTPPLLKNNESLLLTAFNTKTKSNGFYEYKKGKLNMLTMGNYTYYHSIKRMLPIAPNEFDFGMAPIKATNANRWVLKRQSFNEEPNYFFTENFKKFKQLTNIKRSDSLNWFTAELIDFNQSNGIQSQGVLYKPENFDSTRIYPVIITYYRHLSHRVYEFPEPRLTNSASINIPWFVSRGYLVFTPDIYFTQGQSLTSAVITIVSAAKNLKNLRYVGKIGIAGHSVAGALTNYIITQTDLFTAAFEGAGSSDVISSALQISDIGRGNYDRLQGAEFSMGASIWERPDLYLKQSAVLNADKVTTPLLMFHCKNDVGVPWAQAIEMFLSLRRLGKKAWLLQYDDGDHIVWGKSAEDLTIRATQFFDHYLKGMPPPRWMTEGIPASLKGIDRKYELDTTGRKP